MSKIEQVGGKNASLGTMIKYLKPLGVNIPDGFAVTVLAYKEFIKHNELENKIAYLINSISMNDIHSLSKFGSEVRKLITKGVWPISIKNEIIKILDQNPHNYIIVQW